MILGHLLRSSLQSYKIARRKMLLHLGKLLFSFLFNFLYSLLSMDYNLTSQ